MWHYIFFNERLGLGSLSFFIRRSSPRIPERPTGLLREFSLSDPLNVFYFKFTALIILFLFFLLFFIYCASSGNAWVIRLFFITVRKSSSSRRHYCTRTENAARGKSRPFPSRVFLPSICRESRYISGVVSTRPGYRPRREIRKSFRLQFHKRYRG